MGCGLGRETEVQRAERGHGVGEESGAKALVELPVLGVEEGEGNKGSECRGLRTALGLRRNLKRFWGINR